MKKEKFKKLLLPVGLLIMGSGYLFRFITPETYEIEDFLKGLGFAFVLAALFFMTKIKRGTPTT